MYAVKVRFMCFLQEEFVSDCVRVCVCACVCVCVRVCVWVCGVMMENSTTS